MEEYKCKGGYVYMLRFRKKDSKELIKRMAKTNGCSVSEIRREMQYAIDEARNSDDPNKQAEFQRLFGNKIPSPEVNIFNSLLENIWTYHKLMKNEKKENMKYIWNIQSIMRTRGFWKKKKNGWKNF